jgi:hypothetical protein
LLYAKKIAQGKGLVIPDEAKASSAAMSAWIDSIRDGKRRRRARKTAYKPPGAGAPQSLDEITRFRLNDDLLRLWQEQSWTVVFVTHSVYESVYLSKRIVVMAARPGRVVGEVAIEAPYPRGEAFRTSEPYNHYCREVSAMLRRAMAS